MGKLKIRHANQPPLDQPPLGMNDNQMTLLRGGQTVDLSFDQPVMVAAGAGSNVTPPRVFAHWEGIVTRLGEASDGRLFEAFTWRDTPLAFFSRFSNAHGDPDTTGCPITGEIRTLEWRGNHIYGTGVYYDTPDGRFAAQLAASGSIRYISVDPAGVKVRWEELDPETGEGRLVFDEYEIGGATQVAIPAMADAVITRVYTPSAERPEGLAAAGQTAEPNDAGFHFTPTRIEIPPALTAAFGRTRALDAFHVPEPDNPLRYAPGHAAGAEVLGTDISVPFVEDNGTWHGFLAHWGTCHAGFESVCRLAPTDDDFSSYLRKVLETSDGEIKVGHITLAAGHAATQGITAAAAVAHYDDTASRVAYARFVNGAYGIWGCGVLNPQATDAQIENFHRSRLSGDWRGIGPNRAYRLIASLVVNYPGFDMPDEPAYTAAGAGHPEALIAVGDYPLDPEDTDPMATNEPTQSSGQFRQVADRMAAGLGLPTSTQMRDQRVRDLTARVGRSARRVKPRR